MRYTKALFFMLTLCFLVIGGKQTAHAAEPAYEFFGRHLIAQYYDCDPSSLENLTRLCEVMNEAARASGAHILKSADYVFEPTGYTMMILLSESHASIHTYPEHKACFIDFFTCGHHCSAERFEAILHAYLLPKKWKSSIQERK